jgi:dTDP-glucose 4,6-dehydratase
VPTPSAAIVVTGGAGFIGINFVRKLLAVGDVDVINVDKLTYAGHLASLADLAPNPRHHFVRGDIGDANLWRQLFARHRPAAIVNFAAESHVDRSIAGPDVFIETNIVGVHTLLREARDYHVSLEGAARDAFRVVHVSTDEVYGSLRSGEAPFDEMTRYAPNSPYSASKAAADHLVRAYFHTYGLPVVTTHCSNNYGPYQYPEKLVPLMICHALTGRALPVYGDGLQVRDWIHVEDHCEALLAILRDASPGETYNIGANTERNNLEVVSAICALLDALVPHSAHIPHRRLLRHVADRAGHDRRCAIDARKLRDELGWAPRWSFDEGLRRTVEWYLANRQWSEEVLRLNAARG